MIIHKQVTGNVPQYRNVVAYILTNDSQTDLTLCSASWVFRSAGPVASLVTCDTRDGQTESGCPRYASSIRNSSSIVIHPWDGGCRVAINTSCTYEGDVTSFKNCSINLGSNKLWRVCDQKNYLTTVWIAAEGVGAVYIHMYSMPLVYQASPFLGGREMVWLDGLSMAPPIKANVTHRNTSWWCFAELH